MIFIKLNMYQRPLNSNVNTYDKYDSTPLGKVKSIVVKDITDTDSSYLTNPTPDRPSQNLKLQKIANTGLLQIN